MDHRLVADTYDFARAVYITPEYALQEKAIVEAFKKVHGERKLRVD